MQPLRFLQEPRWMALLHYERMSVHTGHQTQSNCSPYGFCNLSLVLRPQSRVLRVLYPSRFGHVL
jgi:hypothetical protein